MWRLELSYVEKQVALLCAFLRALLLLKRVQLD